MARRSPPDVIRSLSPEKADFLKPGERHYRAFVGPPRRYDFLGASQFALLFLLGLNEKCKVLDFGCGSLRLGRLLIPFLRARHYFGIDPNAWLIEDAVAMELGSDAIRLKSPSFSFNADFDCGVFSTKFSYIVAQSILTHAGPDSAQKLLTSCARTLTENGVFLASLKLVEDRACQLPDNGWHYPENVNYAAADIDRMMRRAGLHWRRIDWYHPGAVWIAASKEEKIVVEIANATAMNARPLRRQSD